MDLRHEFKKIENLEKLKKLINEFNSITEKILIEYGQRTDPKHHQIIFQNILQRIHIGFLAINLLLGNFKKKYFKFPILIQMRVCILDAITAVYLLLFIEDSEKFKSQVLRLDIITESQLKNELRSNKNIDADKIDELKEKIRYQFPDHFRDEEELKLNDEIKPIKPSKMKKAIENSEFDEFAKMYFYYNHYSKYEHYGIFSKTLLNLNPDLEFDYLIISTAYIFNVVFFILATMEVGDQSPEEIKKLMDEIKKIEFLIFKNGL